MVLMCLSMVKMYLCKNRCCGERLFYWLTPRAGFAMIECMSTHSDSADVIEQILAELRDALVLLRHRKGKGGRKVIVHIDASWRAAMIELPPETIQVRSD